MTPAQPPPLPPGTAGLPSRLPGFQMCWASFTPEAESPPLGQKGAFSDGRSTPNESYFAVVLLLLVLIKNTVVQKKSHSLQFETPAGWGGLGWSHFGRGFGLGFLACSPIREYIWWNG